VILYLQELRNHYPENIILLKGNHEDIAHSFFTQTGIDKTSSEKLWLATGGARTLSNFESVDKAKELLLPFIESLQLYHETPNHIFVHAGVPYGKTLETATNYELLWGRDNTYRGDKTLIVGHSIHDEVTKYPNNVIAIDTGAFQTSKLSAYDVLNDKIYQTVDLTKRHRDGCDYYDRRKFLCKM
jgi:serine/threonine protein phosphatase 1